MTNSLILSGSLAKPEVIEDRSGFASHLDGLHHIDGCAAFTAGLAPVFSPRKIASAPQLGGCCER